jgi:prolyl oligopeptidase
VTRGVLLVLALGLALPQAAPTPPPAYPPARRDDLAEVLHGTRVPDPYRWLESADSPETLAWRKAEERLTADALERLPDREAIRRRLTALWSTRRTEVPWREAGRFYYVESAGLEGQPVLYSQASWSETPTPVLDPNQISPDGSIEVRDFAVSPDGRWLSYTEAPGGADVGRTRVRELATGRLLPDAVEGALSVCWTADGGGFFYAHRPPPKAGDDPGAARMEKSLFHHVLGHPQERDRLIREWKDGYRWLYVMLSDDGRRAIVVASRGASDFLYAMDLKNARTPDFHAPLVPLLAGREAGQTPMGTAGDVLYVATDLDAPRRRIVAVDLAEGTEARPRTVVPESAEVIEGATVAGDRLAVHSLADVRSRLRLFTLDGESAGEIPLPGIGSVGWALNGRHSSPELWYSFRSFLAPETVYRYDLAGGKSAAFRAPKVPFDASRYETTQVFFASKDGTRVPMFLTAKKGLKADGRSPAFLTAYGGYGSSVTPGYQPGIPLWLEMGGIYAVANIRGGGEYGEQWHRAGSRDRKQNSFDDFIAAARELSLRRWASSRRLAIYGHSNGGLLVGAMVTQRPDLFAAAVGNAGHYDMLRFHRFTVGAGWIPEYGSPEQPEQFRTLAAYSPLHHVRDGTCYPATLLLTGDHDDRVVPSHAYKFAAALQRAQACDRPILLRVASAASHQYASGPGAIAEQTDMFAFVASRLGTRLPQEKRAEERP